MSIYIKSDKDILCGISKATPLQILIKYNVIPKTNLVLERDNAFLSKKAQVRSI